MAAHRHSAWSGNIGDPGSIKIVEGSVLESLKPVNWENAKVPMPRPADERRWLVDLSAITSPLMRCGPVENH